MKNVKFSKLWDALLSSYWFLPSLMAVVAIALAFTLLAIDRAGIVVTQPLNWVYSGGPDGARAVLSAIAGSMATVAGTTFSITIVALQLAASNFGPRLLRNFMQDTGNQIVLGTFIATFIYCILVLRTIHGESYTLFVPQLSVTVGIGLAVLSVAVLIYFIHHASTIIQAAHIIKSVSTDLDDAIDRLFPEQIGQNQRKTHSLLVNLPTDIQAMAHRVLAKQTGYLQAIDDEQVMKLAGRANLLFWMPVRPGKFVVKGHPIVLVYPPEQVTTKLVKRLHQAFITGKERTEQQDVAFPIDQLVEIALRAISPAVNDPFTAMRCIDRLGAGLSRLAARSFPSPYRYDSQQKLRVITEPITFAELLDHALSPIRQYAQSDGAVTLRLLQAIALIAGQTQNTDDRKALRRHADMILRGSQQGLSEECDRQDVAKQHQALIQELE